LTIKRVKKSIEGCPTNIDRKLARKFGLNVSMTFEYFRVNGRARILAHIWPSSDFANVGVPEARFRASLKVLRRENLNYNLEIA
jgi:hypothetical protein